MFAVFSLVEIRVLLKEDICLVENRWLTCDVIQVPEVKLQIELCRLGSDGDMYEYYRSILRF